LGPQRDRSDSRDGPQMDRTLAKESGKQQCPSQRGRAYDRLSSVAIVKEQVEVGDPDGGG